MFSPFVWIDLILFSVCLSDGSTWTPGSAGLTGPLRHSRLGRHRCECPHRLAQQVFKPHKDPHCAERRSGGRGRPAIGESYQQRALWMKTQAQKELCSQLIEGSLRMPVTVMWYMLVILEVEPHRCLKKKVLSIPNQEVGLFLILFLVKVSKLHFSTELTLLPLIIYISGRKRKPWIPWTSSQFPSHYWLNIMLQ